jgi:rod shape-determining protein MreD
VSRYLSLPILFLAAVLQAGLVPQIRFGGAAPDLVLLCVVAWSINAELQEALVWAFVGGIMSDLLSVAPIGTSSLALCIVVFFISGVNRQTFGIGVFVLPISAAIGSVLSQAVFIAVMYLSGVVPGFRITLPDDILYVILPSMAYNFVVVVPVYFSLRWMQKRFEPRRITINTR